MRPSATCLLPPIFATPHWSVSTEHRIIIIIIVIVIIIVIIIIIISISIIIIIIYYYYYYYCTADRQVSKPQVESSSECEEPSEEQRGLGLFEC